MTKAHANNAHMNSTSTRQDVRMTCTNNDVHPTCSPSPLAPSYAFAAAADISVPEDVGAASASGKCRSSKGKGGRGGGSGSGVGGGAALQVVEAVEVVAVVGMVAGVGALVAAVVAAVGVALVAAVRVVAVRLELFSVEVVARGASGGSGSYPYVIRTGDRAGQTCGKPHTQHQCFSCLDDAWRAEFGNEAERPLWAELLRSGVAIFDLDYDAILAAMYALSISAEGDCYLCVPPDPGIAATALGASESALPGTAPAEALHTFTLDSGASRCFFRDSTTLSRHVYRSDWLTPLGAKSLPVPPLFSLVRRTAAIQDAMVTSTTPGGPVAPPRSCRLLSHQNLLWHHRLGHPSLPRLHGMHSCLLVSCLPRSLPPLPPSPSPPCLPCVEGRQRAAPHPWFPPTTSPPQTLHMDVKGEVPDVLIPWIRAVRLQLRERFRKDLPISRLHSDRGGEFSSDLLRDFCCGEGILQLFTLPASPQQNGTAERRIGLVMEVARTSMIHAAAPHFLWPFVVRYAAHPLNLWPRVSLPETSPKLRWTGEGDDASVFWVWGSRWQFYHPSSHRVIPSEDITFDESVPYYRLFPYRSAPPPPPPLLLAPGPPQVDPLPPQDAAPSGVSRVDPLPGTVPVEVVVGSGAARGAASGGAASWSAEPGGGPAGASPHLSPQQEPLSLQKLREWFSQRTRLRSGATGAGVSTAGDTRAGGVGVTAGAGGTGGAAAAGPGRARTRGSGAATTGSVGGARAGGAGAGDPAEPGGTRVGDTSAGGAGARRARADDTGAAGAGARGTGVGGAGARGARDGDTGTVDTGAGGAGGGGSVCGGTGAGGTVQPQPYFLASPLPAPSPYTEQTGGLAERREPESRPASRVRAVRTARRIPRPRPPPVPGTHAMALCPSSVPLRVPLPHLPMYSLPAVPDPKSDLACAASPTDSRFLATAVTDPSFESTAASSLVAEQVYFAAACRLDSTLLLLLSLSLPVLRPSDLSLRETWMHQTSRPRALTQRRLRVLTPLRGRLPWMPRWHPRSPQAPTVKWPPGSPPAFKARYIARGFSLRQGVDYFQTFSPAQKMTTLWVLLHEAAQRDYELHSLDFSTAFLKGSLHEEIWLRRPPVFIGSFPAVTQWSLRRPVYGLRQAPREWHDTLRTTLAALGFTPSTADTLLFLRTDTTLPPFYVLVYSDNLVFRTADTKVLTLVKSELQKRHTCTDLGELRSYFLLQITQDRARRTITLT
ncbi:unnamed protein product [Closterium sp. NIES-53]